MLPNIKLTTSSNKNYNLQDLAGKIILVVNTATKCGFAYQFEQLENLHQKYKEKNLVILGFPCNQFANQENTSDEDMSSTCKINFGVTFTLHKKCNVNGKDTHELFSWLKKEKRGLFTSSIKWNFTKFLIDNNGTVLSRYSPHAKIEKIERDIERLIKN